MPRVDSILVFLLRFAAVYALLILPGPIWGTTYASYYRALGNTFFGGDTGRRFVDFHLNTETNWPKNFDTLIVVANDAQRDATGDGPQIRLGLDTWQMGWIPTALFLALALASPLTWRRRLQATAWGLLLTQSYIVLSLWIYIWNESTRVKLVTLAPWEKLIAQDVENTVIANPAGANLFVPILVFILVTARRGTRSGLVDFPEARGQSKR